MPISIAPPLAATLPIAEANVTNLVADLATLTAGVAAGIHSASLSFSSAQILGLDTTPRTIVAGVPGKVPIPIAAFGALTFGTTAYDATGTWRVFVGPTFGGSGFGLVTNNPLLKLDATQDTQSSTFVVWQDNGEPSALNTGQPLRIDLAFAVTTGDSTGVITIFYVLATA